MTVRLRFLGTGAADGTPGEGRTQREESSLLTDADGWTLLVDAPGHVPDRLAEVDRLDGVVLTHGHRDASGGVAALAAWADGGLPLFASRETIAAIRGRHRPADLQHLEPRETVSGQERRRGPWRLRPVEVPHANNPRFRTYAWRLSADGRRLVYASDVAELTRDLERTTRGADLLVLDGAMYRRSIFSHLRIEQAVPRVCEWDVERILLTQIGRTVPPHDEAVEVVRDLCERAAPAYDGLTVEL